MDPHKNPTSIGWTVLVTENHYRSLDVPAGRYWVATDWPGDIELMSCTPGALTGTPAPPRSFPPTPSTRLS
ncbi:hypothetical protein [Couchioplanes azureus]|uniref:hypothetical protein n=1 Tax=Couchioplanes caeruleus TaxID=56438 RepID=UPI001670D994|nr:hypothetical protein [Couchioplanes caeruleus]GGQ67829.1 hypothetical protein GCM10010166_42270 [Couchioplanes caeruleus subsp. azureus]